MSGQPVKTQSDINKFKNDYLESLNLQESINDMNLQANKTYLLTGQLPPQSQMMDTRTNAEKLKDVEQMKQKIASDLKAIAEPSVAYQIVSKVMESPLNIDNTLFRFLAQRASSLTEQISKLMPYGIAGDINDIERIVDFIKNMYSEQQGKFQSTKSYLNSVGSTSQSSRVMSGNDIDNVIIGLQDLIKNIQIIIQSNVSIGGIAGTAGILNRLSINMENLKNALPTTDQIKLLMSDIEDPNFNNPYPGDFGPQQPQGQLMPNYSRTDMEAFYKFIEKLPKYTEAMALINKIRQFLSSKNYPLVVEGIHNLDRMFSILEDRNVFGPGNNIFRQFQEIKKRQEFKQDKYQKLQSEQTRDFITRQSEEQKDASRAQKVYIINPESDAIWTRDAAAVRGGQQQPGVGAVAQPAAGMAMPGMAAQQVPQVPQVPVQQVPPAMPANNNANAPVQRNNVNVNNVNMAGNPYGITPAMWNAYNNFLQQQQQQPDNNFEYNPNLPIGYQTMPTNFQAIGYENYTDMPINQPAIPPPSFNYRKYSDDEVRNFVNTSYDNGMDASVIAPALQKLYTNRQINQKSYQMGINMIRKVGRGLTNRSSFIGFGISEINAKSLNNDIITIRRAASKSNYMDMPSKKVSKRLSSIVKTISGGGIPKYEDISSLDNEEKEYLHKLVNKSNLNDRLSVPAPSKDAQEKDIHTFEIMKGQIMSGNDSVELVKKFKLLVRKLAKQGLLPKADVDDIIETLSDMNY